MADFQPITITTAAFKELQAAHSELAPTIIRNSKDGKLKKNEFYSMVIEKGIEAMKAEYQS